MINPFRRWFSGSREGDRWIAAADWAEAKGHRFARSRDGSGFVIEPGKASLGWRLEWGAPQRHYFSGPELRVRAEVGATGELQMLVITRDLMALLEQQVFEESTDGTETRMDDDLPEEMRWLVLYTKVPRSELGVLRERFGALSNFPRAALSWLDAPLTQQLETSSVWLAADQALVWRSPRAADAALRLGRARGAGDRGCAGFVRCRTGRGAPGRRRSRAWQHRR
jgi:hypothetical protein